MYLPTIQEHLLPQYVNGNEVTESLVYQWVPNELIHRLKRTP